MGLHIRRLDGRSISWSYSTLHMVRYIAALSTGWGGSYEEFYNLEGDQDDGEKGKETWELFPQYHQLMHFCDAEGIILSDFFLRDVDYSKSFFLGSFGKLKDEVNKLQTWILDRREYLLQSKFNLSIYNLECVTELAVMMNDEDSREIIIFQ